MPTFKVGGAISRAPFLSSLEVLWKVNKTVDVKLTEMSALDRMPKRFAERTLDPTNKQNY